MAAACIDTSVALLWLLSDTLTPEANLLRRHAFDHREPLIAPPLFRPEITSAIRRWLFAGNVDEIYAREALNRSLRFPVHVTDDGEALQLRAFDIATALNRPRAYDTQYVALAEFHECELWTADRRLVNAAQHKFPWVRWIGDYRG